LVAHLTAMIAPLIATYAPDNDGGASDSYGSAPDSDGSAADCDVAHLTAMQQCHVRINSSPAHGRTGMTQYLGLIAEVRVRLIIRKARLGRDCYKVNLGRDCKAS
jgi:hypothetical protein